MSVEAPTAKPPQIQFTSAGPNTGITLKMFVMTVAAQKLI
jgi:hypothetical protein